MVCVQAALWALDSADALSRAARQAIAGADEIRVSVVTPWELVIKSALERIALHRPVPEICGELEREFGAAFLPVSLHHVLEAERLPRHHGDPFDRLLIAQARTEGLAVVTRDRVFARNGLRFVRA
jgi:PIN domain nuclease of toxin-antitoxin system